MSIPDVLYRRSTRGADGHGVALNRLTLAIFHLATGIGSAILLIEPRGAEVAAPRRRCCVHRRTRETILPEDPRPPRAWRRAAESRFPRA